ncbi:MAG: 30S ribosomal protein S5 [Patescibacteria group bacterium]|nr:30S ribosomal protein S5 [Patescibacteria group bacterium]
MKERRQLRRRDNRPESDYEQKILDLARVTRVTKGGKHLRFRACLVLGDKKGSAGYAVSKGADVAIAVNKAAKKAKKDIIKISLVNETIPHEVRTKFGAAKILIKPAPKGTGIKAGGAMRIIFELAGVPNVVGKILGSKSKINNTKATFEALKSLTLKKK